jgi:hypothetical protein
MVGSSAIPIILLISMIGPRWIFHYPDEKVKKYHHVDQKLTTTTQCTAKATALQLYDGATVIDYSAPNSSGQTANCRIIESTVMFEAQKAVFEHHIALEGL